MSDFETDPSKILCDLALSCAMFYENNTSSGKAPAASGAIYQSLQSQLSDALSFAAEFESKCLRGCYADRENPGWIVRLEGALCIRIPCHLIRLFPDTTTLRWIFKLAQVLRTTDESILHLSGSNTVKEIFSITDDIDFCELVPVNKVKLNQSIAKKLKLKDSLVCVEITHRKLKPQKRPFDVTETSRVLSESLDPEHAQNSSALFKYLSKSSEERPFDVTNLLIACDHDYHSKGLRQTFAYQEIRITPTDFHVKRFDNVTELGRYIVWLTGEIRKYRKSGEVLKAIKRALSLARICWMKGCSQNIDYLIQNSTIMIEREIETIRRLKRLCNHPELGNGWLNAEADLGYYEKLAKLDLEKAKLKERRLLPEGARDRAFSIIASMSDIIVDKTNGALSI